MDDVVHRLLKIKEDLGCCVEKDEEPRLKKEYMERMDELACIRYDDKITPVLGLKAAKMFLQLFREGGNDESLVNLERVLNKLIRAFDVPPKAAKRKAAPSAGSATKRPRGAAPKGKFWCDELGTWVVKDAAASVAAPAQQPASSPFPATNDEMTRNAADAAVAELSQPTITDI